MTEPLAGTQPSTDGHGFDSTTSWVLYALHLCAVALLSLFALMGVMMTDSCGSVSTDLTICNGNYLAAVLFGYWGFLAFSVVAIPIAIIVATRKGRRSWTWALGGIVVTALVTVLFVKLMLR